MRRSIVKVEWKDGTIVATLANGGADLTSAVLEAIKLSRENENIEVKFEFDGLAGKADITVQAK